MSPRRNRWPSASASSQREAGEEVQRRVEAQDLLDGGRGRVGVREQPRRVARRADEDRPHPVADGVHRRLVAGVEQQHAGGDQLVGAQPLAVRLGRDQLGDQVVRRPGAARARRARAGSRRIARRPRSRASSTARSRRAWYIATMACDQASSRSAISSGTPSSRAITMTGSCSAKPGSRSNSGALDPVDQRVRQRGDLRAERRDPARGEGAQHQPAQPGMRRRLAVEHREVVERVEVGADAPAAPASGRPAARARSGGRAAAR